jgi:hypothetical protein
MGEGQVLISPAGPLGVISGRKKYGMDDTNKKI